MSHIVDKAFTSPYVSLPHLRGFLSFCHYDYPTIISCLPLGPPPPPGDAGHWLRGAGQRKGVPAVYHSEEITRGNEIGNESERGEPILEVLSLQDGDSCSDPISTREGEMAGVSGRPGRLLARSHPPSVLQFSDIPSVRGDVPAHQPVFRTFAHPSHLHQSRKGGHF